MSGINFAKPVLGISAFSGTGKTELLTKLIPLLKQQGLKVAVIKQAHHDVDIDKPGKDSYQLRQSGATPVVLASDNRIAVMIEKESPSPSELDECLELINPNAVDLVLIEGFKHLDYNKLFLFRHDIKGRHQPIDDDVLAIINAETTLAVVTDLDEQTIRPLLTEKKTVLDINNPDKILHFILQYIKTETGHE